VAGPGRENGTFLLANAADEKIIDLYRFLGYISHYTDFG
jgi:hypothetical protein